MRKKLFQGEKRDVEEMVCVLLSKGQGAGGEGVVPSRKRKVVEKKS